MSKSPVSRKRLPLETSPRNAEREPQHVERALEHEEQREPQHVEPRRRRHKTVNLGEGIFDIPTHEIPEGLTYEFKRYTNMGQEDPFYLARMREQGWEPVPPSRHPNWVPPGYKEPHIIKGGQILMDRPKELTDEANRETRTLARQQIREAEQRLGLAPKDTLERVRPNLVKEIGRMVPTVVEE